MLKRIFLFLLLAVSGYSLSWQYVGTNGFTASQANYFDIQFDVSNKLYILYSDVTNAYKANLILYNAISNNFTNISANFTTNQALQMQLLIDTNSFSFFLTNVFYNYITNVIPNRTYSNLNFTTNIVTNSVASNGHYYYHNNNTSTNLTAHQSVMFVDKGKLYRASLMHYNGTTWDTNNRGFTTNQISDFKGWIDIRYTLSGVSITNVYTNIETSISVDDWVTATNTITNVISPYIVTQTTMENAGFYITNNVVINGVDYGVYGFKNDGVHTNFLIMTNTNYGLCTNTNGSTNWNAIFINILTNYMNCDFFNLNTGMDPYYSNSYADGIYSNTVVNTILITNVYSNDNRITNWVTNTLTNQSTNIYTTTYTNIVFNDGNVFTALISDKQINYKANVMQLSNNVWRYLGTNKGFSSNTIVYPSICKDTNGYWYTAYQDTGYNFKAKVMKYTNAGQWFGLGVNNMTNKASYTVLRSYNGNFYLAFNDLVTLRASVYAYTNAGRWYALANPNFSSGRASYIDMSIWTNGNITVAFADGSTNNRLTVYRYTNSGSWFRLGSLSTGTIYNLKMTLNTNGQPVILYSDSLNNGKLSILEYR